MDETKQKPETEPINTLVGRGELVYSADGRPKIIVQGQGRPFSPVYPFRQGQKDARGLIASNYGAIFNHYVELRKQKPLTEKECEDCQKVADQLPSQVPLTKDELDIIWLAIRSYKCVDIKAFLIQKCNISDPINLSWAEIISHLKVWLRSQPKPKADLASTKPSETKQNALLAKNEEQEGVIVPKPPEFLQTLLWLWRHGKKHWKLILLAAIIMLLGFILQLVL